MYFIGREVHLHLSHPCHFHQRDLVFPQCLYIWFQFYLFLKWRKKRSWRYTNAPIIMLCTQRELSFTCPWGFNNPLIEEDEFPFAVVDGGLAVYIADICNFAWAFFTLYMNPKKEVIYYILRPTCDISFCPVRRLRKLNNYKNNLFDQSCIWCMFQKRIMQPLISVSPNLGNQSDWPIRLSL